MEAQGKHIQIKLLTVSLINIELYNWRCVNILLLMIFFLTYRIGKLKIIAALLQKDRLKQLVSDGLKRMNSALPRDHRKSLAELQSPNTQALLTYICSIHGPVSQFDFTPTV